MIAEWLNIENNQLPTNYTCLQVAHPQRATISGSVWLITIAEAANVTESKPTVSATFHLPSPIRMGESSHDSCCEVILPVAFVGAVNTLVSVYAAHSAGDMHLRPENCKTYVAAGAS